MRVVTLSSTDQTIVLYAYDSDGAAVTLAHDSAGLTLSYRIDSDGREGTPVSLTPIARSVAGTHEDGAITSKGSGKHEVDLPDAAFATAGKVVTLEVSATGVDTALAERLSVESAASGFSLPTASVLPDRTTIESVPLFVGETIQVDISVFGSDGETALDLSGRTMEIVIEGESGNDIATIDNASITIGGAGSNVASFNVPASVTSRERVAAFSLRDTSDGFVLSRGKFVVHYAAEAD